MKDKQMEKKLVKLDDTFYVFRKHMKKEASYIGIDEVGIGALAGRIVASSVILPYQHGISELPVDSKMLNEESIERLAKIILQKAVFVAVGYVEAKDINEIGNEDVAKRLIWKKVVNAAKQHFSTIPTVVDGKEMVPSTSNQQAIVGADATQDCVSAASIVSKYFYNQSMKQFDFLYPEYGFAKHKGYNKPEHLEALKKYGLTPIHRKNAKKVKEQPVKKEEKNLSEAELKAYLSRSKELVEKGVANEWEKKFITEQYKKVFTWNDEITPKCQHFIVKTHDEMKKRLKKEVIKKAMETVVFKENDLITQFMKHPINYDQAMKLFTEFAKQMKIDKNAVTIDEGKNIGKLYHEIKTTKEVTKEQSIWLIQTFQAMVDRMKEQKEQKAI